MMMRLHSINSRLEVENPQPCSYFMSFKGHVCSPLLVLMLDFALCVRDSSCPSTSTVLNAMSARPRYKTTTTYHIFSSFIFLTRSYFHSLSPGRPRMEALLNV